MHIVLSCLKNKKLVFKFDMLEQETKTSLWSPVVYQHVPEMECLFLKGELFPGAPHKYKSTLEMADKSSDIGCYDGKYFLMRGSSEFYSEQACLELRSMFDIDPRIIFATPLNVLAYEPNIKVTVEY